MPPGRSSSNAAQSSQRVYPAEYADRLRFIKRAQALGFSLEDVAALLRLNNGTGHVRARQFATRRVAEIEVRIVDLTAIKRVLEMLIRECEHAHRRVPCPIIQTLQRPLELASPPPRRERPRPRTVAAVP